MTLIHKYMRCDTVGDLLITVMRDLNRALYCNDTRAYDEVLKTWEHTMKMKGWEIKE